LYLSDLSTIAAKLAIIGRFMHLVIQVIGVVIAQKWIGIISKEVNLFENYINFKNKILVFSFILATTLASAAYLQNHNDEVIYITLITYVVANTYSATASMYSSLYYKSIPTIKWYTYSVTTLFALSMMTYLINFWYLSIVLTAIYFLIHGRKCLKGIKCL
jgi:hypothetical protein